MYAIRSYYVLATLASAVNAWLIHAADQARQRQQIDAVVLEDSALSGTLVGMSFLKRLESFHVDNGKLLLEQ